MMERLILPISVALCLFLAGGGVSFAEPEEANLTEFMDLGTLLRGAPFRGLKPLEGMAPVLQDDDWGWGDDEKKDEGEEAPPEEPGGGEGWGWGEEGGEKKEEGEGWGWGEDEGGEEAEKPPAESPGGGEGGKDWGDDWGGEDWEEEPGDEPGPVDRPRDLEDPSGPRVSYARKTRIGIDGGLFLPFGGDEEYNVSGLGGVVLGFGLPPFLGNLVVTCEVHIGGAFTSSDQEGATATTGFEVDTKLILGKYDVLFHFMPTNQKFNLYYFLGLAVGYEMSDSTDKATDVTASESYPGFLVDTGLGAWLNLGGPVDLVLKLEFNLIPMSQNVQFFATGQAGIQVKF